MSMMALAVSFIAWAVSFVWLHVVFIRNGYGRGMAMFLSSTAGGLISTAVYYAVSSFF